MPLDGISTARPVTIVSGYLGAGKTTFVNQMMAMNPQVRYAIIENEIGQVAIDGLYIERQPEALIELTNGCICCSLNDDLYAALEKLALIRDKFDELIIECTGIAYPSQVAEMFLFSPLIKSIFPLERIICMVDVELIEDQMAEREEVLRQMTESDAIILNKTQFVRSGYVDEIQAMLAKTCSFSKIMLAQDKVFPFKELQQVKHQSGIKTFRIASERTMDERIFARASRTINHTIQTRVFYWEEEIDLDRLYLDLFGFLSLHRNLLYRMKGLVYKKNPDRQLFLQSVGSRVHLEYGGEWPEKTTFYNKLVFIGKDLHKLPIKELLEDLIEVTAVEEF